jgi:integrase
LRFLFLADCTIDMHDSSFQKRQVAIRVEDVAPNGYALARATVRPRKTGRPVRFELTEQTRQAVDDYLKATSKVAGEVLFTSRRRPSEAMTTRQYARLVAEWIAGIGLDLHIFGTHSLRRTKATLIYRRTGNLRAVQLLLGHCTRDEGRSFEVGNQVLISSPRKLLSSKAMVVNVAEKSGRDSRRQG